MNDSWNRLKGEFEGLAEEYRPGSKQKRLEPVQPGSGKTGAVPEDRWDSNPKILKVKGVDTELFFIAALAQALGKRPVTVRQWIREGNLPDAKYRTRPVDRTLGNAGRRLWTRLQIEAIVRIAGEAGLLPGNATRNSNMEQFRLRIWAWWKEQG